MKYKIFISLLQILFINLVLSSYNTFLKLKPNINNTLENEPINEPKVYSGYCFMKIHNFFYDLTPLLTINDKSAFKTFSNSAEQINFNICGKNAPSVCLNKGGMVVSNMRCTKFAGDIEEDRIWTLGYNKKKNSVITIELPQGEVCKPNNPKPKFYKTFYELTCSDTKKFEISKDSNFDPNICENIIKINTKYACPSSKFSPWYKQIGIPKKAVGVILLLIGLYLMILGNIFWRFNSFIINTGIKGLIIFSFMNLFFNVNLLICFILGLGVAIISFYHETTAKISLGVICGFIFGNILYIIFINLIQINPQTLYWILITLSIIGLSILGGFIDQYMVVITTSLVGGYALVRGISIFAGGYPDESYVMKLINAGEYSQFGRVYGKHMYTYMSGILISTVLGFLIQSIIMPKEELNIEDNKPDNHKDENKENKSNTENNPPDKKEEDLKLKFTDRNEKTNLETEKLNNQN